MKKKIGILALQGCVHPHRDHIENVGAEAVEVRSVDALKDVDALILPGGESTTMLRLMAGTGLEEAIKGFPLRGPVWGICAGAILIASEVIDPQQRSLSLLPLQAARNAYGSQAFSFKAHLDSPWDGAPKSVDFIRAPKLKALSDEVNVLVTYESDPVLLQYDNVMVSAFHTELGTDPWLHQQLISMIDS